MRDSLAQACMAASTLKDRYHDWLSAKIAERVAALTPDEIFRRSEGGAALHFPPAMMTEDAQDAAFHLLHGMPRNAHGVQPRFRRLMVSILEEGGFPSLEDWEEAYARNPEPYDAVIMGFRNERAEPNRAFGT